MRKNPGSLKSFFETSETLSANAFVSIAPSFLRIRQIYSYVGNHADDASVRSWVPGTIGPHNIPGTEIYRAAVHAHTNPDIKP